MVEFGCRVHLGLLCSMALGSNSHRVFDGLESAALGSGRYGPQGSAQGRLGFFLTSHSLSSSRAKISEIRMPRCFGLARVA